MLKSRAYVLTFAVLSLQAWAEPATYVIDPAHVTVGFRVSHIGFANVVGFFTEIEGSFVFDEATGALSDVRARVGTDSVFSNDDARDNHLRGRDFLNARRYPEMRFSVVSVERVAERQFEINGELELLGIKNPLMLSATLNKVGDYPIGRGAYAVGVSATGTLSRSDYGMDYAVDNGWVGDDVEIFIELEALRQ
jgi:polyisoprenoid-binding protein YceI